MSLTTRDGGVVDGLELDTIGGRPGHSVLGSLPRFLKKFGYLKIGTDRFLKILETDHFGFRLFRFGFDSNRTNRTFSGDAKIMINMHVLK
jgi:hypothetical protein